MSRGFTLIELLVVVLIIGVLSAIAIPMYQGAVDKSHFSTLLPATKAIKNAEEAFKMANGEYTSEMTNLDVSMENSDITYTLSTPNNTSDPNAIRATSAKLPNVRLASYLDDSPMFAGQLHCEAKTGDERAERLCDKLLMGQELTSADGYNGYLLDQDIDKATCDEVNRKWSTSKTKCYKTQDEKCQAVGGNVINDEMCGYQNATSGIIIENEQVCIATKSACNVSIKPGGICLSSSGSGTSSCQGNIQGIVICNGEEAYCGRNSTYDGGVCVTNNSTGNSWRICGASTFKNGAICYGRHGGSWGSCSEGNYQDTSCCCGSCGSAPRCAATQCEQLEKTYEKYFN